ncbi:MAG: VOC family protein [Caldilineaceae bacterium]|nr:VOC family protein [Caldilineaceae bacterium]HRJ43463.1 VOC family protein [Caldilineaceae bacterium]
MPGSRLLATNPFFYYADLDAATRFYTETLGLELVADFGIARTIRTSPASFLTLMDIAHSLHKPDEPKAVTLAFVTDEVEKWYAHLQSQNVPIRHPLKSDRAKAHEGFVALDPAGYFLEFERFNPHPENERLLPQLAKIEPLTTATPGSLPLSATVLWLYYKEMGPAQGFLAEQLGLKLLVNQGWAKVYGVGRTSFIGPVEAGVGLHPYAPAKLVTVGLITDDLSVWRDRMEAIPAFRLQTLDVEGVAGQLEFFYGFDPEDHYWEFEFYPDVPGNERLRQLL